MPEALRPYLAAFASRFQLMLQYRAAAVAGFATQCWWGGIKVMIYSAFYRGAPAAASAASIDLAQTITYTWMAQGLLALVPWACDPDIALAVRTGAVSYDRLRPVDAYGLWYARSAGWMAARVLPRAALMVLAAGLVMPLVGLGRWSLRPPADVAQAGLFALSALLALSLAAALVMLINIIVTATLNDRGPNTLVMPLAIVLSGNLIPLAILPDAVQPWLIAQPFAGILDIPLRIYMGALRGEAALWGLGLQVFWTVVLGIAGRLWLERVMRRLEVQGG